MGAILNGMAVHKGVIAYGASFLVFTDYARPAIRLSALSGYPVKWVFTHDSIGVGEDGPTHQPVEHMASLRAIPELIDLRPADANEVREAWKVAIMSKNKPVLLALSRQNLPTINRVDFSSAKGLHRGAYILRDYGKNDPQAILMGSGSEIAILIDAAEKLEQEGYSIRVVSFPSFYLFKKQPKSYQQEVLLPTLKRRISLEAGVTFGWHQWVGDYGVTIGLDRFGESGKYQDVYEHLGITSSHVIEVAHELLEKE